MTTPASETDQLSNQKHRQRLKIPPYSVLPTRYSLAHYYRCFFSFSFALLLIFANTPPRVMAGEAYSFAPPYHSPPPALVLSCPDRRDHIEMSEGRTRQCTLDGAVSCGPGFHCEQSVESPVLFICCGRSTLPSPYYDDTPAYRCPNAGQIPVVRNNRNVFCEVPGQRSSCPPGSLCVSSISGDNMYICCYTAHSTTPICPSNTVPQTSVLGYVPYVCMNAANDAGLTLCCSRTAPNRQPICPNQQTPLAEGARWRYCTLSQQAPCPAGYSCQESMGQPGVYVCCSIPMLTTCPTGYTPSLNIYYGNIIHCSPSDVNVCPADSQCLPAQNRPDTYLCCKSSDSPRVCPRNQNALLKPNGQPETCSGPGSPCSKPAYTCQFSQVMRTFVCCGQPSPAIVCADGRETYAQDGAKPYTCSPLSYPSSCPAGYDCSYSNVPNVNVCCRRDTTPPYGPTIFPQTPTPDTIPTPPTQQGPFQPSATFRPPVEELTCPTGWSAYEDGQGANHFCQDALDMSCPQGFSCAQSSITTIFMCCRLAFTIQCPQSYSTLLVNNSPRLCINKSPSPCPTGYLCLPSSVPSVHVCCSPATRGGDILCRDGGIPAYMGQYIRYCVMPGQTEACPPSYICSPSNRPGISVCCHSYPTSSRRSPPMRQHRQELDVCGDYAQAARSPTTYEPIDCTHRSSESCPLGFLCQPSMINTRMYCCRQDTRCPALPSHSLAATTTSSRSCSRHEDCHGKDERCFTPSNSVQELKICCHFAPLIKKSIELSEAPPSSYQMETTHRSEEKRPRCLGRKTLLLSANPVSCYMDEACPTDYECSAHTTTTDPICCQRETHFDHICPDNREPTSDDHYYCDSETHTCPIAYLCKRSPQMDRRLCCTPIAFCRDGHLPQLDAHSRHAKRCFHPYSSALPSSPLNEVYPCSRGYRCEESTVQGLFVCCTPSPVKAKPAQSLVGDHPFSETNGYQLTTTTSSSNDWVILEGR